MIKRFLFAVMAMCGFAYSYAQTSCGTDNVYNKLKQQYPEIATNEAELEQSIQQQLHKINFSNVAGKTTAVDDTTFYDVPIVVHIIHDYGTEYITDDAVFNAVKVWSATFLKQNADTIDVIAPFIPYIGNARIRLHLATKDPNGNPTKGITRRQSYLTKNAGDEAKLDWWPNDQYINIWLINKFSDDHSGAAAYAYYPSSGAYMPYYDGVICLYNYVNTDKTIPHELGHVLNLSHTWGSTNNPGVACGDDNVDDTPPTMGHSSTGCTFANLYDVTCATNYVKNNIDYPDTVNSQNIMDYTYCEKMFTKGQVQRMRTALTSSTAGRNNLYTNTNVANTGALAPMPDLPAIPDFSIDKGVFTTERCFFLCANSSTQFSFRNRSWNDTITSVQWSFSNGASNATSASMSLVNNQFSQPGWVTVSLTATGNNTAPVTVVDSHAVYIADNSTTPWGAFSSNFWDAASVNNWPMFNYYGNTFKWEWFGGAGFDDGSCIRYRSYDNRSSPLNKSGTPIGDYDDIFTPGVDLTNAQGTLNLNFYTAGGTRGGSADSLMIYISTDCGTSWKLIKNLKGSQILNNSKSSEFVPNSASQWKAQTVAIPSANYTDKVFFKFRYWPDEGSNNLYMDKIGISQFTTEVKEVMQTPGMVKLYPNPSHGDCTLAFLSGNDGKSSYIVRDITGRVIYTKNIDTNANTPVQETIARSVFPSVGFYFITANVSGHISTQKIVVD